MIFFTWRKKQYFVVDMSRFLFFWNPDLKTYDVIIGVIIAFCVMEVMLMLLLNPKHYQNEIWPNIGVLDEKHPNMFSTQCWRLKTSSKPFYDFIEITIQRNVAISNSWYLPFLIAPYLSFQKSETLESWYNWLLSDWTRLLNWKGPGTWICSSPPNCLKNSWKLLPLLISISWPSLLTQWVVV